jgi:hypothetical protein
VRTEMSCISLVVGLILCRWIVAMMDFLAGIFSLPRVESVSVHSWSLWMEWRD